MSEWVTLAWETSSFTPRFSGESSQPVLNAYLEIPGRLHVDLPRAFVRGGANGQRGGLGGVEDALGLARAPVVGFLGRLARREEAVLHVLHVARDHLGGGGEKG